MSKIAIIFIALCASTAAVQPALAQKREVPIVNSIGRFFGYGYTQAGYHSAKGRHYIARQRHPASNYASRNLQYAYQPSYQPTRPYIPNHPLPTMNYNSGVMSGGIQNRGGATPQSTEAETQDSPTAPKEPPPEWLKQYLDNKNKEQSQSEELERPEPKSSETPSPSDQNFDLLESPDDTLLDDPVQLETPEESDDLLLMEDDDDLLSRTQEPVKPLLRPIPQRTPRIVVTPVATVQPNTNRYR